MDRQLLQHNVHAAFQKKQHINTWDDRSSITDSVKQFLKSIQAGDTIAILPKARHVGWLNYVFYAAMQVFCEEADDPGADSGIVGLSKKVRSLKIGGAAGDESKIYRSLEESSHEIRLIAVESGAFDDPLVCQILYAKLGDATQPAFEALSYCWGSVEDERTITVLNDAASEVEDVATSGAMLVTANLYDALRYVRRNDNGPARTIWADAICIDQANLHERSRQVALMPEIYTEASNIVVWLGQANDSAIFSIQEYPRILARYAKDETPLDSESDIRRLHAPLFDTVQGGPLLVDNALFKYEYFRRTWVLQEVFNARSVSVHCGQYVLDWASILRMNQCLLRSMFIPNPVGKHVLPALFAGLFELLGGVPASSTSRGESLSYKRLPGRLGILDVFLRGLDLDASDVRDKVFALLTFGEETSDLPNLPDRIRPNYTKSIPRVFADFTRWWIASHNSLEILSAIHVARDRTWQPMTNRVATVENLGRPSWSIWHTGKSFWRHGTLGLAAAEREYTAGKGTRPDISLLAVDDPEGSDSHRLSLRGHRVATIDKIGLYPYYQMQDHVKKCTYSPKRTTPAPTGSSSNQEDAETSCPMPTMHDLHSAYEHIFDPIDERGTWRYGLQHQFPIADAQRVRNDADLALRKLNDHYKAHLQLLTMAGAIECHGTPYCEATMVGSDSASEGEERRGLCPPATRVGDLVAVLHGAQVPFVLRPVASTSDSAGAEASETREDGEAQGREYYLVGECFLAGCMRGEAIRETTDEQEHEHAEIFHLV